MPNATVTIRKLKNKNSGIDASIPDHKEIPGLLGATIEYQIVVVTILQCFKLPKHKETDVVQFMIPKHVEDFEELRRKLTVKFPGTLFPPLPRKTFGLLESSVKERRTLLDTFVKYVVGSLKTAASPIVLQFLGASPLKAGSSRAGEKGGSTESEPDLFEEQKNTNKDLVSPTGDLFGDLDEDDLDLFTASDMTTSASSGALFRDSATTTPVEPTKGVIKLFEDQDLGGALKKGDVDSLFLVPDAVPEDEPEVSPEDNSDLLNIEDDLDTLLKVTTPSEKVKPAIAAKPKPSPAAKPNLAPKPRPAPKPSSLKTSPTVVPPSGGNKVVPPTGEHKVASPSGEYKVAPDSGDLFTSSPDSEVLDASDIMKYIQSSSTSAEADLDLFS